MPQARYKRIVLKISGESLCPAGGFGIGEAELQSTGRKIAEIGALGAKAAVVVGGGNFVRGRALAGSSSSVSREAADYMGMLATVINSVALAEVLRGLGAGTRVFNAFETGRICEKFSSAAALECFESGETVLLAGGTGNPFFTTDTCAALRAAQLGADLIIKATKVDGVFSADPNEDSSARLLPNLEYGRILEMNLQVIDHAAVSLCRDSGIPVIVLNIFKEGNIRKAVCGQQVGTYIGAG
jgi:uridylate kinase